MRSRCFAFAKEMDPDMTFRQFLDMRRDSNAYQALEQLNGFESVQDEAGPKRIGRDAAAERYAEVPNLGRRN